MTFEHPAALWGLLVIPLLAVLHLRFRRRRRVQVSSLLLWDRLTGSRAGRRGLQRLRDALAFLLVALAATGFTLALAVPVTGDEPVPAGRLVLVLDASRTTGATTPDGRTRLEHLRDHARAALDRLGPGDEVTVWIDDGAPFVAAPPTLDPLEARAALDRVSPSLRRSSLLHTLERVEAAVRTVNEARPLVALPDLLVLTDRSGAAVLEQRERARQRAGHPRLPWTEWLGVLETPPLENLAVTDMRPDASDPGRLQVRVRRTDAGAGPATPRALEVRRGDVVIESVPLAFGDGPETLVHVPLPRVSEDDVLSLRVVPRDAFPADDTVRRMLRARRPWRVGVVAPNARPSPFLVEALRVLPDRVSSEHTVLVRPGAPPAAYTDLDAVVVEGEIVGRVPHELPYIAFGRGTSLLRHPAIWASGSHPILRGVDLSTLRLDRSGVLPPVAGDVPLIETTAGRVAIARGQAGQRGVQFGFEPDASTLPLEAAFPLLIRNALDWLRAAPALPPSVRSGHPLPVVGDPALTGARVVVQGPGPARREVVLGPDGDFGLRVPLPVVERRRGADGSVTEHRRDRMTVVGLGETIATIVNWIPGPDHRIDPQPAERPASSLSADEAVARLPDRRANEDTRSRHTGLAALVGVLALFAGALLLHRGRA